MVEKFISHADQGMRVEAFNVNTHSTNIFKAVIAAGLQGNIGRGKIVKNKMKFYLSDRSDASPVLSSILSAKEAPAHDGIKLVVFGHLAVFHESHIYDFLTPSVPSRPRSSAVRSQFIRTMRRHFSSGTSSCRCT